MMSLSEVRYYSQALQKATGTFVIHPDQNVQRPYHCMVLLHGLSDDYTIWQRRTSIERYVADKPLIVVMPDGGRGFYVDALQGYQYLQAIAYELPELIGHHYTVDGSWCTAGLSMGGYGALRVALERPDMFRSAVSHSGAVTIGRHYPTEVPTSGHEREEPFIREFLPVFGPVTPGGKNDLVALAQKASPRPAIRFDCGTEDFLLPANRSFHADLTELGIAHEYEEFPGDHNWAYWDEHIREAVEFNMRNLNN
ncbi:MAG: esterase family protein [Armatimonadetes bacterium]|nr:esterase family protein [Armatimonadota bacterium]MBS1703023.1 esterase family protein [Armatimonadota bacterium]